MSTTPLSRSRLGAVAFVAVGVLFLLYPAIRPYSDESSMDGAVAIASPAWVASHLFAMIGFILLPLGLFALHRVLGQRRTARALVVTWLGAGLVLPYYGAEDFGLNVIAGQAVRDQNASLLRLVSEFRFAPVAGTMFLGGLVLLAVGVTMAAVAVARSGVLSRWSAVPLAAGFVLFIPQFFGSPALRIAHGVLIAAGGLWLGLELWRGRTGAGISTR
ncbi:hypothetical protein Sme01_40010 [Sphaerisporangium melleum]|uniref:DUF4386 domain-containing protein n=1 Tax=Sphaerisporangium melleum TaxID=321316 RepID=A0A917R3R7_9ACTN|nr:hypothetical protein [Sphaerisporangium melleum]GGK86577.1 hypothetical protein GCM10007964_31430 [Sphaerisporangium melleum]GII71525.1 hypothetical protein Sme01_40010 [Sphaerisporangium melleum]